MPTSCAKLVASHFGGTRTPLAVSWPKTIHADNAVRTQFHHVNDIVPTIYDVAGIKAPQLVDRQGPHPLPLRPRHAHSAISIQRLFQGKTVFVTGGDSEINLGVASNFAALGADLAICGHSQGALKAYAGANVLPVAADVRTLPH